MTDAQCHYFLSRPITVPYCQVVHTRSRGPVWLTFISLVQIRPLFVRNVGVLYKKGWAKIWSQWPQRLSNTIVHLWILTGQTTGLEFGLSGQTTWLVQGIRLLDNGSWYSGHLHVYCLYNYLLNNVASMFRIVLNWEYFQFSVDTISLNSPLKQINLISDQVVSL